jgi:hypothetical protein
MKAMQRRDFINGLAGSDFTWPLTAENKRFILMAYSVQDATQHSSDERVNVG